MVRCALCAQPATMGLLAGLEDHFSGPSRDHRIALRGFLAVTGGLALAGPFLAINVGPMLYIGLAFATFAPCIGALLALVAFFADRNKLAPVFLLLIAGLAICALLPDFRPRRRGRNNPRACYANQKTISLAIEVHGDAKGPRPSP